MLPFTRQALEFQSQAGKKKLGVEINNASGSDRCRKAELSVGMYLCTWQPLQYQSGLDIHNDFHLHLPPSQQVLLVHFWNPANNHLALT